MIDDTTEYARVGVRWYGNGAFIRDRAHGLDIARKQQWIVRSGDVLYNKLFAWKGSFAVAGDKVDGHIVSDKFPTFAIDLEQVDPGYLSLYFRSSRLAFQAERLSKGAAAISKLTLNPPQFWDLTIPLPPLADQRRISARFAEIFRSTEVSRDLRVRADSELFALRSVDAQRFVTESAAEVRPLGDLVAISGGGTPPKSNATYWEGSVPWISPKDMKVREISDSIDHISRRATEETSARLHQPGAVLVVTRGMILAHTVPSAVLSVPAAINQDMKSLRPSSALDARYLCEALWALNGRLLQLVERSTHDTRKLQTDALRSFELPLPRESDQPKILQALRDLSDRYERIARLQQEIRLSLDALLPSVVNSMFDDPSYQERLLAEVDRSSLDDEGCARDSASASSCI
jgi:type I restriction enzyme S subunit